MAAFTFIHAADLHLGAPFRGLDLAASEAFPLAEAGFRALERLEFLCRERGADFLILAGDIYDDKDGVLRARFALRDMFLRLRDAGVRVFVAHGNHDPLQPGPLPVAWPDNVTVFGPSPECFPVTREGETLALAHGVSHAGPRETANLAGRFTRYAPGSDAAVFSAVPPDVPAGVFQIAVLHCAVGGAGDGHAPYAPCSLTDLTEAGFDYWALGHVHQGKILSRSPYVVYPGSFQGLHVNETGKRGCCVVRVDGGDVAVEEVALAPVEWRRVRFVPGDAESVDALESSLIAALEAELPSDGSPGSPEALFCRVILAGQTGLDAVLRRPGSVAALLERLRGELTSQGVWIKDIRLETAPLRDEAALVGRGDLAGEVARLAEAARRDEALAASLAEKALAPLRGHQKLHRALGGERAPGENAADMATAAGALLVSMLEED